MAKRYDQKTKDEVVAFIQIYNREHGRGGQSAAVEKFSINPITIRNWMDKAGVPTGTKKGRPVTKKKTPGKAARDNSAIQVLQRMTEIQNKLHSLKTQVHGLENEYESLKSQL